jgi:NAD+ diphosphatase
MNPFGELSSALGYANNPLNRMAELRDRPDVLAAMEGSADARAIVLAGDIPILKRRGDVFDALFSMEEAHSLGQVRECVFLGHDHERPIFGVALEAQKPETHQGRDDLLVIDARSIAVQGLLPPEWLGPLGEAKSLLYWHRRHRFCAVCGQATAMKSGGWKRACLSCDAEHFPRTDPVAIMMAVKGDKCVLGRQSRFPPGMYSCLAGFIEPGETIENAVRRELFEEAGVRTGAVRYLASQPWPFPGSMMIGCIAEALDDALVIDGEELEDARWFSRDEVISMLKGEHPNGLLAPQPIAIANAIMRAWALEGETA